MIRTIRSDFFSLVVISTAFIYFTIGFAVTKVQGICFYLLALLGLFSIGKAFLAGKADVIEYLRKYAFLHLSMYGMVIAVFLSQAANASFDGHYYDGPMRLIFLPLIIWSFLQISENILKKIPWFFVAGSFISCAVVYIATKGGVDRGANLFMPTVVYTELANVLGYLSVFFIFFNQPRKFGSLLIKMLGGLTGFAAPFLFVTRGAMLALPVFITLLIYLFVSERKLTAKFDSKKILITFALFLVIGIAYISSGKALSRFTDVPQNVQMYTTNTHQDSSVGIRLQLWKYSWKFFMDSPFLGFSPSNFKPALKNLEEQGLISGEVSSQPHAHNDFLHSMVTTGIIGLFALFMIYLIPAYYFARNMSARSMMIRSVSSMGLMLSLGYMCFGLVDTLFFWKNSYMFYVIILAILFAFIIRYETYKSKNLLSDQ